MGEKSFTITFDGSATLTVDEVWPDGDAPANPTLLDVHASDQEVYVQRERPDREVEPERGHPGSCGGRS